jgi:hypothetical protein
VTWEEARRMVEDAAVDAEETISRARRLLPQWAPRSPQALTAQLVVADTPVPSGGRRYLELRVVPRVDCVAARYRAALGRLSVLSPDDAPRVAAAIRSVAVAMAEEIVLEAAMLGLVGPHV